MHDSGVIDFQSHTLHHHRICVSPQVVDFLHPGYDRYIYGNVNVPVYRLDGRLDFTRRMPWGTPIYKYQPRMAGSRQYFDDESLRQACIDYVVEQGGESFFRHQGWRRRLYRRYREARGSSARGEYETPEERERAILEDLQRSKRSIESHLVGKSVDHLCYPWFLGSRLAAELARRAGYAVNYWGILPERRTNRRGDDLFMVPRIDERYIDRLPGRGRKSLRDILVENMRIRWPGVMQRFRS
jgi:hypothetical protein